MTINIIEKKQCDKQWNANSVIKNYQLDGI